VVAGMLVPTARSFFAATVALMAMLFFGDGGPWPPASPARRDQLSQASSPRPPGLRKRSTTLTTATVPLETARCPRRRWPGWNDANRARLGRRPCQAHARSDGAGRTGGADCTSANLDAARGHDPPRPNCAFGAWPAPSMARAKSARNSPRPHAAPGRPQLPLMLADLAVDRWSMARWLRRVCLRARSRVSPSATDDLSIRAVLLEVARL